MHPLLKSLQKDHYNFLRLLNCLQREVDLLDDPHAGHRFNLALLQDALDYIHTYPQVWHHPVEDRLLARLHEKAVPGIEEVDWLLAEHRGLEAESKALRRLFQAIAAGSPVTRERIVAQTRAFLHGQLAHIHRENATFYPLLARHLTVQDWDQVAAALPAAQDGLFSDLHKAQYQHLSASLIKEAQATQSDSIKPGRDGGFARNGL